MSSHEAEGSSRRDLDDLREQARRALEQGHSEQSLERLSGDPATLVEELKLYSIELRLQNEELRRTQTRLNASRDRYYLYYDLAPLPYFSFDRQGSLIELNLKASEMLKVPRSRLRGRKHPFTPYLATGYYPRFQAHIEAVFTHDAPQETSLLLKPAGGGEPCWVDLSSRSVSRGHDQPICVSFARRVQPERESDEVFFGRSSEDNLLFLDEDLQVLAIEGGRDLAVRAGTPPFCLSQLLGPGMLAELLPAMDILREEPARRSVDVFEKYPGARARLFRVPGNGGFVLVGRGLAEVAL